LHAGGATVVEQRLDRRAHGTPGEQHVVDDHHRAPGDVEVDVRSVQDGRVGATLQIVAVKADVQIPERNLRLEQLFELCL
jgi:hypothetical protein